MSIFGWLNDQLLRMQWLSDLVTAGVTAVGLDPASRVGGSVQFFVYDVIKIFILLSVLIFGISWVQSYFPPERTRRILRDARPATEEDWSTEYLAPILAIRIVDTLDQAIDHIERYGSHHTDAIVTENYSKMRRFLREVDSSSVMINASTRFADGYEYGLGAEIGISTDKFHARGPVGLEGLTSLKWVVFGDGNVR